MFNESPRLTKLIAGGLTVLAMGAGGVAMAEMPAPGTAGGGNATEKSQPNGQDLRGDSNNGWRCDNGNGGAGDGNPALGGCPTSTPTPTPTPPPPPPTDNPPTVVEPPGDPGSGQVGDSDPT